MHLQLGLYRLSLLLAWVILSHNHRLTVINRDCSYRSYVIIMPHRAWVGRLNRVRFRWVMFDSILIAPLQRKTDGKRCR